MNSTKDKEEIKMNRSKRKRERNRIKSKIKKQMKDTTNIDLDIGIQLDKDKERWLVSWHYHFDFPDDFDAENRKGIEDEYHIVNLAATITKEVEEGINKVYSHVQIIKSDKKNYNLTQPVPPMYIIQPEKIKNVNGKWIKIKDAYLMSDQEIKEMIDRIEGNFKDTFVRWIENDIQRLRYYDFVGGSEYEHECFRLKRFFGMRVYGSFEIPAIGEYRPSYLNR